MSLILDKKSNIISDFPPECFTPEWVKSLKIKYKNWKGEVSIRSIYPDKVWYGCTEYHPDLQWLLKAWDNDKEAMRDFALTDILEWIKE